MSNEQTRAEAVRVTEELLGGKNSFTAAVVRNVVERYGQRRVVLASIKAALLTMMKRACTTTESTLGRKIVQLQSIARVKDVKSVAEKVVLKPKYTNLQDLPDVVGGRVTCLYATDVAALVKAFTDLKDRRWVSPDHDDVVLTVTDVENKAPYRTEDFGYRSVHIEVCVQAANDEYMAEIQVRTSLAQCWASMSHDLKYKRMIDDNDRGALRLMHALSAVLEAADGQVQQVQTTIKNLPVDADALQAEPVAPVPSVPVGKGIAEMVLNAMGEAGEIANADADDVNIAVDAEVRRRGLNEQASKLAQGIMLEHDFGKFVKDNLLDAYVQADLFTVEDVVHTMFALLYDVGRVQTYRWSHVMQTVPSAEHYDGAPPSEQQFHPDHLYYADGDSDDDKKGGDDDDEEQGGDGDDDDDEEQGSDGDDDDAGSAAAGPSTNKRKARTSSKESRKRTRTK